MATVAKDLVKDVQAAVKRARLAALGNSNDAEIEALQEALDLALAAAGIDEVVLSENEILAAEGFEDLDDEDDPYSS